MGPGTNDGVFHFKNQQSTINNQHSTIINPSFAMLCGPSAYGQRNQCTWDRLLAILYPTSHLIEGSVRFDDRFETAHPSPNRF
jgi:hypothetical protein